MKLTPLEIQQMVFQVRMRGYDRDEVNRFLEEVAQAVEGVNRDNATLRERVQLMEQQVADLRRNEATLSNTLLSAQSMADDVKKSAIAIAAAVYHLAMRDELLPRFSKEDMPKIPAPGQRPE